MGTFKKVFSLSVMAIAVQACGGGSGSIGPDLTPVPPVKSSKVLFNPALGGDGLPFPNDLFFASTADGSINLPGKPSTFNPLDAAGTIGPATSTPAAPFLADPQTALNTMDGFATTAPMVVRFSDPISSANLKGNVRVFSTSSFDPGAAGAVAVNKELYWGVDFVAGVSGGTSMLILPLRPLNPSISYIVVIQKGVTTTGGFPVSSDDTYALLNGSYQLAAPLSGTAGLPDFILENDGVTPCDFTSPGSVAICTDVNTEDYQTVVDNVPPAAAGAGLIAGALAGLESQALATMSYSSLWQLEQLRRVAAKHLAAVEAAANPVDPTQVALSYSISTEDVGSALNVAKAKVDGAAPYDFPPATSAAAPTIEVLNPIASWDGAGTGLPWEVTSPGPDGDLATPGDALAYMYLGNLKGLLQFVDPGQANTGVWEAVKNPANWGGVLPCTGLPAAGTGSSNLVGCNGYNPSPALIDHSIPVLISAPLPTAGCVAPLPVVIYQHGITTSRATMLAIADTLASQCVVGVGIDMPKHGILPVNDPFGASQLAQLQQAFQQPPFAAANPTPTVERLVQVASPLTGCQAQQGVATLPDNGNFFCPSGDQFINLTNLANSRDTLRQSVVDLHSLYRALSEDGDVGLNAGTIGTTIDPANIHFAGVSLGGIVGSTFVAQQPALATATLNVAGGGIAKILDGSPSFEPSITAGLYAAAGLSKPSGSYEGFLIIAQTMVDNVDPINFAEAIALTTTPVLVQEVIGNPADTFTCLVDGTGCSDQVVPNNVYGGTFGPAWGLISGTGQQSFLANQNGITTPVALSGTDVLSQGTGFVVMAALAQADPATYGAAVVGAGPLGGDPFAQGATMDGTVSSFKGIGLPSVGPCGAMGTSGVVRFREGDHGSMLSPAASPAATELMQRQLITFVVSDGGFVAADLAGGLVLDRPSSSQAACIPAP
jgi:hypothetical protein